MDTPNARPRRGAPSRAHAHTTLLAALSLLAPLAVGAGCLALIASGHQLALTAGLAAGAVCYLLCVVAIAEAGRTANRWRATHHGRSRSHGRSQTESEAAL